MITAAKPKAVVFDLGGVIVALGPATDIVGDRFRAEQEFWPRWLMSAAVRDFEGGRTTAAQFGERFVAEFELAMPGDELVERFRSWPQGLFEGAEALLTELARNDDLEIAALSNSNPLHWHEQRDAHKIRALFDRAFLSYELGVVKPDRAIFDAVTSALDVRPDEILFFDDNQLNVDGARAAGWTAVLAQGPGPCRAHLASLGLVTSDQGT
ncbi:MAG: HAD family phosphatase [Acidimicrobiales bacterium]|nr:HAD family phosphatase [Acidimicrobiales bacterium]